MSREPDIATRVRRLEQRYYGKFPGFVVDDQDPKKRGRLRALVPEVLGDVETGWAEGCFPYLGPETAYAAPPVTRDAEGNPTTMVWIEFRGGDPSYPIWTGVAHPASGGE